MSYKSIIVDEVMLVTSKHDEQKIIDIFAATYNSYCYFVHDVLLHMVTQAVYKREVSASTIIDGYGTYLAYDAIMDILCFAKHDSENDAIYDMLTQNYIGYHSYLQDIFNHEYPHTIIMEYLSHNFRLDQKDADKFIEISDENSAMAIVMQFGLEDFISKYFDKVDEYALKFINNELGLSDIDSISKQVRLMNAIMVEGGGSLFEV